MHKVRPLVLAILLATSALAFAAQPPAAGLSIKPAAPGEPIAQNLHITVDPRSFEVVIDKDHILSVGIAGLGATQIQLKEIRPGNGSSTWVGHLKDFGEDKVV
jgi:hypothetical protein